MAKALKINIKTTNELVYIGSSEWNKIEMIISSQGKAIQGVTISLAITDGGTGTFDPASGVTDTYGFFTTRFQVDNAERYTVTITATKAGYTAGAETLEIIAISKPTVYSTNGSLYLNIIEKRKLNILDVLKEYLDNDPAFYPATGASDKITYMTEWNYQTKDFPLIVASSDGPNYQKLGIHHMIDEQTYGGWVDLNFGLNLICEERNILERLTEKCIFILGTFKFYELYGKYGIYINEIRTGSVVTEPYAAKFLFANRINLNARIEFAYNITANDIIETMTTQSNFL